MAQRINRIGGDYYEIALDDSLSNPEFKVNVGSNGKVTITGDLDVLGDTTSIGSSELIVDDNTITVNNGETGAGITLGTAGIIIDRGTRDNAEWFFDESLFTIRSGAQFAGAFTAQIATGDQVGIYASSITTDSNQNLYLVNQGSGIVTVTGTVDYEKSIWNYTGSNINLDPGRPDGLEYPVDDDALVNAKGLLDYVRDYFSVNFQDKIVSGVTLPTRVETFDDEVGDGTSRVEIAVDDNIIATFYETRIEFENLEFNDNVITNNGLNGDIILKGAGTGKVVVDDYLQLNEVSDPASSPSEGSVLYSKTLGDGGTGVFFENTDGTRDELVSRNKALLYAIIF